MPGTELPTDLLWDVISKTALVLALLYGTLWAVRRLNRGVEGTRGGPSIQVIHSAHLGPGRSVHLLGVGDRVILVGATSQQISLLTEMEQAWVQAAPEAVHTERVSTFERCLRQAVGAVEGFPSRLTGRRGDGGNGEQNRAGGRE